MAYNPWIESPLTRVVEAFDFALASVEATELWEGTIEGLVMAAAAVAIDMSAGIRIGFVIPAGLQSPHRLMQPTPNLDEERALIPERHLGSLAVVKVAQVFEPALDVPRATLALQHVAINDIQRLGGV
eukprot:CAMPEP_0196231420 /NCGR_PEP_ID=MMETSP0913-20130531/2223_1 /TAXON_ID=49265 /ORGANISM="Thalassiosira rotula, Strain GSO102" /LENGTH=127 /DNA_ID=CAMNT_0041511589 /DNA_START=524 /DNA_END=906 /DNA_ORIENTATION=+